MVEILKIKEKHETANIVPPELVKIASIQSKGCGIHGSTWFGEMEKKIIR